MGRVAPYTVALWALLALGVALRTVEYAAFGSLWLDELFITLNVTSRDWDELVAPLAFNQVAPVGFLAVTKAAAGLFPMPEAGLRLFPYLASLAGLFLFWRVATRFLDPPTRLAAIAIFAMSPSLLWFSRNVKQYSGDVAVALLLVLLALRFREGENSPRDAALAGGIAGVAILFSQPAVMVVGVLLALQLLHTRRSGRSYRPLALLAAGCIAAGIAVVVTSMILSPETTRTFMSRGWTGRGFMPRDAGAPLWVVDRVYQLIGLLVGQFVPDTLPEGLIAGTFTALMAIGLYHVSRKPHAAVLLAPVIAALLGAAFRILPFSNRVSIYAAPPLLVLSLGGLEQLRAWLPRPLKRMTTVAAVGLAAIPAAILLLIVTPPQRREEARPVLEELRARWREGDRIYITGSSRLAMRYYGRPLGLRWEEADNASRTPRESLENADRLRGEPRAWVFYTHATPCRQQLVRSYLEAIGTEIERIEDPYGNQGKSEAAAYLYDLSDPGRLSSTDAATFPAPEKRIAEDCGYPSDDPLRRAGDRLEDLNPFE